MKDYKITVRNLLTVKSIITIMFGIVYCALAIIGKIDPDKFHTIFLMIASFYFGTQLEKQKNNNLETE
jgi:uncharacterized membrane protein YbaN (DUF454 family)